MNSPSSSWTPTAAHSLEWLEKGRDNKTQFLWQQLNMDRAVKSQMHVNPDKYQNSMGNCNLGLQVPFKQNAISSRKS